MHRWGIFPTKTGWEFIPPVDLQAPQLQNIGITDRKGRDIYQGDILKFTNPKSPKKKYPIQEVFWYENKLVFRIKDKSEKISGIHCHSGLTHEVIGNIYENPELLK